MDRFSLILIALVLSDFLVHGHPGFGIDGTFGFYAWYGLGTCVAMVLVAKGLGLSLKRPDTYYEGEGRGASEAGAPGAAESATAGRGARGAPPATVAEAAETAQGVRAAVTGDSAGAAETSGKGGRAGRAAPMADWPPALVLVLAGSPCRLCRRASAPGCCSAFPLVTLALVWNLDGGAPVTWQVHGYEVAPVRADPLGRLFAIIFAIMAFAGALFALRQARVLELAFAFVYAGSAIGVALAGDLLTLFVFWELMALASTGVLLAAGGDGALRAAGRYFVVHMLGGAFLMAGVLLHVSATGSLAFTAMEADSWGTWLILAGVLVNAAAPPLSPLGLRTPIRSPPGAAWCSSPPSPPRRRCMCSSGDSRAPRRSSGWGSS